MTTNKNDIFNKEIDLNNEIKKLEKEISLFSHYYTRENDLDMTTIITSLANM